MRGVDSERLIRWCRDEPIEPVSDSFATNLRLQVVEGFIDCI